MAKNQEIKTNAMRILEKEKVPFESIFYQCDEFIDGIHTADLLGLAYEIVYKTLVVQGHSKNYYVFVIPIAKELDLKKAAKSVQEKSVQMLALKEITQVTGYVRGGCTAIAMKKQFVTRIHEEAKDLETLVVSGGKIGVQLRLVPEGLLKVTRGEFADLCID